MSYFIIGMSNFCLHVQVSLVHVIKLDIDGFILYLEREGKRSVRGIN